MSKKEAKILQFPRPAKPRQKISQKIHQRVSQEVESPKIALQPSAVFWHLLAFLFPSFAVWQGLYLHWEVWYSIIILLLFMLFFLFFIPQKRLELLTDEAQKPNLWQKMWNSRHIRGPSLKAPPAKSSVFGTSFANDGRGSWGAEDDDDEGITIEEYLEQRKEPISKKGFDWNWQRADENFHSRKKISFSELCVQRYKDIQEFCQKNWVLPWAGLGVAAFWLTSLLWGPLLYWAIGASVEQRLGLWQGMLFALVLWNLCYPLLEQQQKRKLFCALAQQDKTHILPAMLPGLLKLAIELGPCLAMALFLWALAPSVAIFGLLFLLLLANTWVRMSLLQQFSFPLYVYRLSSCLSASLGLFYL